MTYSYEQYLQSPEYQQYLQGQNALNQGQASYDAWAAANPQQYAQNQAYKSSVDAAGGQRAYNLQKRIGNLQGPWSEWDGAADKAAFLQGQLANGQQNSKFKAARQRGDPRGLLGRQLVPVMGQPRPPVLGGAPGTLPGGGQTVPATMPGAQPQTMPGTMGGPGYGPNPLGTASKRYW